MGKIQKKTWKKITPEALREKTYKKAYDTAFGKNNLVCICPKCGCKIKKKLKRRGYLACNIIKLDKGKAIRYKRVPSIWEYYVD